MKDQGISFNEKCTCVQKECKLWGNCVLCVQNHVKHGDHIPECMQNILRETIGELAHKVEYKVEDKRPKPGYLENADKDKIVQDAKKKHLEQ